MNFFAWLGRSKRPERELDEEIRAHLAMAGQERIERGENSSEAEANARREFGNAALVKEVTRDMLGWSWLEVFLQDLRYGLRQLRRNPGFALLGALALALGLGANTGIFSLAEAVLFPPFTGAKPSRLVTVYTSGPNRSGYASSSYPDYLYYREHSRAFSAIAAYARVETAWTHNGTTELRGLGLVSNNYFDVARVRHVRGRFFMSTESHGAGTTPVVIVSYRFWQEHLASTGRLAAHALTLNGNLFTVIGVAPKGFEGIQLDWGRSPDFWVPMNTERTFLGPSSRLLENRQERWCLMVGRLRPRLTLAQARSEVRLLAEQLEHAYPDSDKGRTALLIPFNQGRIWPTWRQKITGMLWVLGFFAGLVLFVACADVANLLLARGASRQKEIGVRLALGASRIRIMRQLLTESVLVSLTGAGLGLLLAHWMDRWTTRFGDLFTVRLDVHPAALDERVLVLTLILAVLTAAAFGLAPAFQASRVDLTASLKQSGPQTSSGGGSLRHALVVAEVSIAFIGVAGAAMLLHTLWNLDSTNVGFDPHHVLCVSTEVFTQHYKTDQGIRFYSQLLARARALQGVRSAALAYESPLTMAHFFASVEKPSQAARQPNAWQSVEANMVSPDYFGTMRIPLLQGRDFGFGDNQHAPSVVIVNRTMARLFWPHENPVGTHLLVRILGKNQEAEVVGVAAGVKQHNVWEAAEPLIYEPFSQSFPLSCDLLVRTDGDPMFLLPAVRQQVDSLDPQVPVSGAETMEQVAAASTAEPRMAAWLVSSFGALVLLLAVAGIYGVITYWVVQRTHEIGIRMAVGAQRADVLKMVIGQGFRLMLIGVTIGIAGALMLNRFLSNLLYGVKPAAPLTLAVVSLILIAVALLACYVPARRAARVDPMVALRHE
jgi:predicted permease